MHSGGHVASRWRRSHVRAQHRTQVRRRLRYSGRRQWNMLRDVRRRMAHELLWHVLLLRRRQFVMLLHVVLLHVVRLHVRLLHVRLQRRAQGSRCSGS